MSGSYKIWPGLESHPLGKAALKLRDAYARPCRLSPLIAMSDPKRTPDYLAWAKSLPESCAVIYRFETFDRDVAQELFQITRARNQQLIIRDTVFHSKSKGTHFKRRTNLDVIEKFKKENPTALISLAALKKEAYVKPLPNMDALLVSAIFKSASPSAGEPIGVEALKGAVEKHNVPIFALGGINTRTVKQLENTGIAGIAAIGSLKQENIMSDNILNISKVIDSEDITFTATYPKTNVNAVLNLSKARDGVYNAHHTGVPKSLGGKGVGTALVKAMSEDAHKTGYKIIPGCPFVAVWFKRKPEWADMAALEPEKFQR